MYGYTVSMILNQSIFLFIHDFAGKSFLLDQVGIFLAGTLPMILLGILLFIYIKQGHHYQERRMIFLSVLSGGFAYFILKTLIVLMYPYPRPYMFFSGIDPLITQSLAEGYQSFPSAHTMFFFAISTMVFIYNKRLGVFFLAVSSLMGIARIFVGVHWPFDIVVGILLGVITSIVIHLVYDTHKMRIEKFLQPLLKFVKRK